MCFVLKRSSSSCQDHCVQFQCLVLILWQSIRTILKKNFRSKSRSNKNVARIRTHHHLCVQLHPVTSKQLRRNSRRSYPKKILPHFLIRCSRISENVFPQLPAKFVENLIFDRNQILNVLQSNVFFEFEPFYDFSKLMDLPYTGGKFHSSAKKLRVLSIERVTMMRQVPKGLSMLGPAHSHSSHHLPLNGCFQCLSYWAFHVFIDWSQY